MSKIDLIPGTRVGRWTILQEVPREDGPRRWRCRCDCGNERDVLDRSLRYGGSTSCGCLRKERAQEAISPDLTGKTFGDLTVLEKAGSGRGGVRWRCRCSCGGECTVLGTLLTTGKTTRCTGSVHEKNYAYMDISGQRFSDLVALYPARRSDKSGSVVWHCRCDCGNEVDVPYKRLRYGNQKSCGCRKKEHDQKLQTFLTHVAGTSIEMLSSKKVPTDNTTGYRGVYHIRGKYVAKIVFRKKQYFLGTYENIADAAAARAEAEEVLFDGVTDHYRRWKQLADRNPEWGEENPVSVVVHQENGKLDVAMFPVLPE